MPLHLRSSFEPAFWLLPAERRTALAALHRFCRAADQSVDEAPDADAAARAVAGWRAEIEALYGGVPPRTAVARALVPHVRSFAMRRDDFERLLDALADDARGIRFERVADLARYCDGVAGAPGCLALAIFGCPDARAYAESLGRALQLTNVLRDLRADLRAGRVYLPLEDLARYGLTPESMLASVDGETPAAVSRLAAFERVRAREWYSAADRSYLVQPRAARKRLGAARAMQGLYRALLDRLERGEALPRARPAPPRRAVWTSVARSALEAAIA